MNQRTDDTPAATGATPETDAFYGDRKDGVYRNVIVEKAVEHARQLERQRDDKRRELAEAQKQERFYRNLAQSNLLDAERAEARVRELEAQPPSAAAPQSAVGAPAGWYCGCGHTNGFNLAVCACCGRKPNGEHP